MKRLLLCLLFAAVASSASAQSPKNGAVEPRVRVGISGRYSHGLCEWSHIRYDETGKRKSEGRHYANDLGISLALEGTVRVTGNWNVGAGFGLGFFGDVADGLLAYAKAEYLYGSRPSRWFNYVNLGSAIGPYSNVVGSVGGGYRMAVSRRIRIDFTVGFDYARAFESGGCCDVDMGSHYVPQSDLGSSRLGVGFGIAMHF